MQSIASSAVASSSRQMLRCARYPSTGYVRRASGLSNSKGKSRKHDPVIFTGIQPTGTPHLGNYLGMFLPFLELQRSAPPEASIYLSIVGLHAITMPQDRKQLVQDRRNMLASLLACGVDPERTCLYLQEQVPEHTELAWYLNAIASVGRLQRMTTWKSKLAVARSTNDLEAVNEADLKLGLLAYPVLQAADIMLYKSTLVPVGEDQLQHLELCRDIAESFNRQHGEVFPLPEISIVPSKRILSLRDPSQKMSKSAPNPSSRITLTDSPKDILAKLKSAVTDSQREITYDPVERPGVANLLTIWSACDTPGSDGRTRTPSELAAEAREWGLGKLKATVGDVVVERLKGLREEYERLKGDEGYLREVAEKGRAKAAERAAKTMEEVRKVVGLSDI